MKRFITIICIVILTCFASVVGVSADDGGTELKQVILKPVMKIKHVQVTGNLMSMKSEDYSLFISGSKAIFEGRFMASGSIEQVAPRLKILTAEGFPHLLPLSCKGSDDNRSYECCGEMEQSLKSMFETHKIKSVVLDASDVDKPISPTIDVSELQHKVFPNAPSEYSFIMSGDQVIFKGLLLAGVKYSSLKNFSIEVSAFAHLWKSVGATCQPGGVDGEAWACTVSLSEMANKLGRDESQLRSILESPTGEISIQFGATTYQVMPGGSTYDSWVLKSPQLRLKDMTMGEPIPKCM